MADLFSGEFYRLARRHMNEGGMFVQWVQLYEINTELVILVTLPLVMLLLDYCVSEGDMDAVVLDRDASFMRGYDFATLLGFSEGQKAGSGIGGVTVDRDGIMLFVIGSLGKAYRGLPDGTLTEFGKRGSAVGKFGVPGGIAADRAGNLLVTDKLRGVVIIFDKEFRFINEFGYRGTRPGNLIVPGEITVDTVANRVYVSQLRRRGVNIYQLEYGEEPAR